MSNNNKFEDPYAPSAPQYYQQNSKEQAYEYELETKILIEDDVYARYVAQMQGSQQAKFLFKVYSIVLVQLLFTITVICLNMFIPALVEFNIRYIWVMYIFYGVSLVTLFPLYCCMKVFPLNVILLVLFTATFSWAIGMICSVFSIISVLTAMAITAFAVIMLTGYVMISRAKLHWLGLVIAAVSYCFCMALLFTLLFSLVFRIAPWWHMALSGMGALLFCLFILFDTSRIIHTHRYDQYIDAAVTLYVDIIGLFVYVLALVGGKNDLAKNWNIDVAHELENYLTDLAQLKISFDGGNTSVNFAEGMEEDLRAYILAALLIQGSAAVYAKKVEYLYTLVSSVLEHFLDSNKKSNKEKNSDAQQDNDDAPAQDKEPDFLPLDDIDEGTEYQIDLQQVSSSKFQPANFNRFLQFEIPHHLAYEDSSREGTQFKLTSCAIHSSGALLLEDGDQALMQTMPRHSVSARFLQNSISQSPAHPQSIQSQQQPLLQSPTITTRNSTSTTSQQDVVFDLEPNSTMILSEQQQQAPVQQQMDHMDDDDDDHGAAIMGGAFDDEDQPIAAPALSTPQQQARSAAVASTTHLAAAVHVWEPLDANMEVTLGDKPYAKKKTFKIPKLPKQRLLANTCVLDVDDDASIQNWTTSLVGFGKCKLKTPYFASEFDYVLDVQRKQKKIKSEEKKKALLELATQKPQQAAILAQEESSDEEENGRPILGGHDSDSDEEEQSNKTLPQAATAPVNSSQQQQQQQTSTNTIVIAPPTDKSLAHDSDDEEEADQEKLKDVMQSYDDLCRKYIDTYMQSSDRYLQESRLVKRVQDWQAKIVPYLEDQEKRHVYDIHDYGDRVIDAFPESSEPVAQQFADIVTGKPTYEICRYFLATLHLANLGNVELKHRETVTDELPELEVVLCDRDQKNIVDEDEPRSKKQQQQQESLFDDSQPIQIESVY